MRCGRPESDHHAGPFETERQALDTPAVRAVYTAFEAAPGQGRMQPPNLAMLRAACEGADVELARTTSGSWHGSPDGPQARAVVAGLIDTGQERRKGGPPVKQILGVALCSRSSLACRSRSSWWWSCLGAAAATHLVTAVAVVDIVT